jgi:hypothetical protein
MPDFTTFEDVRADLARLVSTVNSLPLVSPHRAGPITELLHALGGRIGEVEREAAA